MFGILLVAVTLSDKTQKHDCYSLINIYRQTVCTLMLNTRLQTTDQIVRFTFRYPNITELYLLVHISQLPDMHSKYTPLEHRHPITLRIILTTAEASA